VIRDSLAQIAPAPLVWTRFAAATILLVPVLLARRRAPGRAELAGGVLGGAFAAGGFVFQAIGLRSTSAGSSAFLTCAGTLLAGFLAWPILGVRPGGRLVIGLILALAGAALLWPHVGFVLGSGEAWTMLGALAYALQVVALARWAPRADTITLTAVQVATIAVLLSPYAPAALRALGTVDRAGALRFGYLAVAGSVVAPILQVAAQRALAPGRIGLLFALEPVFALAFALTVGGERFAGPWWAGAALILIAVALVEAKPSPAPASTP
jgi:drug/metabolite transporter (DMT)-like permease